jgi:hypothetical protein
MQRAAVLAAVLVGALLAVGAASAADAALFGGATAENGKVRLTSNATTAFSGIDFDVPAGTTFADLGSLGADVEVVTGNCGGGSPRFQLNVDGKNVFVYLGAAPGFTSCTSGPTGNLLASADARFDLSQLGGPFYGTYADAVALVGAKTVTGIQLVVDAGWFSPATGQSFLVDNVVIDGVTYDFTARPATADDCKNGGWQTYAELGFKNQGDCVSYVSTGGHNGPAAG